jgi:hypothetical protein
MESGRFDGLVRSLTPYASRRTIVGLSLGGLLTKLGFVDTEAKKRRKKKKKRTKGCPALRQCGPGCCPEGKVCGSNGACVDPSCCSGDAICGRHTSVGRLCCIEPQHARCCCDSTPGSNNGYVHCCTDGVDCNDCPYSGATGGITGGPPDPSGVCARGGDGTQSCPG